MISSDCSSTMCIQTMKHIWNIYDCTFHIDFIMLSSTYLCMLYSMLCPNNGNNPPYTLLSLSVLHPITRIIPYYYSILEYSSLITMRHIPSDTVCTPICLFYYIFHKMEFYTCICHLDWGVYRQDIYIFHPPQMPIHLSILCTIVCDCGCWKQFHWKMMP